MNLNHKAYPTLKISCLIVFIFVFGLIQAQSITNSYQVSQEIQEIPIGGSESYYVKKKI